MAARDGLISSAGRGLEICSLFEVRDRSLCAKLRVGGGEICLFREAGFDMQNGKGKVP